jgi:hypothetical protein
MLTLTSGPDRTEGAERAGHRRRLVPVLAMDPARSCGRITKLGRRPLVIPAALVRSLPAATRVYLDTLSQTQE